MKKHTVLFIEWSTVGREFEMDFPLMYFFENYLDWNVEYECSFNLPSILKNKPDLIVISSTGGAKRGLQLAQWAKKSNILIFSSFTEGMFRESDIGEFLWGWNNEREYSEQLRMLWSYKAYDMSVKHFPGTKEKLRVSGAIGFDKYKLLNYQALDTKGYQKVIGYAAFDFNNIMDKKDYFIKEWGEEKFNSFMSIATQINSILSFLVKNNPGILFLLRSHPGDGGRESLEFKNLLNLQNVKVVENDISIVDVIANSDIWLNYNSSTNLEAWLLGKPSISFNTDESRFSSDILYGSILENDYRKIQSSIDEYYQTKKIKAFEENKGLRERLIYDYIGYDDGLNHVRYMSFLKTYIDSIESGEIKKGCWNIPLNDIILEYIKHLVYSVSKGRNNTPFLRKWALVYSRFDKKQIDNFKDKHYSQIDNFYSEHHGNICKIYNSNE